MPDMHTPDNQAVTAPIRPHVDGHPAVIQGGMGVAVSNWALAKAVSMAGQLGVVSGTAIDAVVARRLQDGDEGGHVRRALGAFPLAEVAERVLDRYFLDGGRAHGQPYAPIPRGTIEPNPACDELTVVSNFVEVWLAKEGHEGKVGVNLLEKVQLATPSALYGCLLAEVDYVLIGAGIPAGIPSALDSLAAQKPVAMDLDVDGASQPHKITFDPVAFGGAAREPLPRPTFLAIVSLHTLATWLTRQPGGGPDGFVIESHIAGGHNAPPRSKELDASGQPAYGERDMPDLAKIAKLGLPFWLAGGYATPKKLAEAQTMGAVGIQAGTAFALSRQSGITDELRCQLIEGLTGGDLDVRTSATASPTGFPFKVVQLAGTVADGDVYRARDRVCDLGYLRQPYQNADGSVGYRCPAEPQSAFVRKGGSAEATEGRNCLCNGLTATVGLGQVRRKGDGTHRDEPPIVTLSSDLSGITEMLHTHRDGWDANDVLTFLGV